MIITHKMREVREIADRVTVLRAGKVVLTDVEATALSNEELVTAMVGESVAPVRNSGELPSSAEPIIELRAVARGERRGVRPARRGPDHLPRGDRRRRRRRRQWSARAGRPSHGGDLARPW